MRTPRTLLLRRCGAICCGLLGLCLCLGNYVCLVDGSLNDLLLLLIQILSKILVQSRLFLLEAYDPLVSFHM